MSSKTIPAILIALAVASLCDAKADAPYGRLPMAFEANQGQTDANVKYLSHGQGYGLFLTPDAAVLSLRTPGAQTSTVVRMEIAGANGHASVSGAEQLPGVSNYYVGRNPAQWHTQIPNYAKVKYSSVYPGVDLVYYGNQQQLEYDFIVAPGADPNAIAIDFKGVDSLTVNEAGDLVLATSGGSFVQQKPVVYQDVDGERRIIAGRYAIDGTRATFKIASYDPSRPLVIDPTLAYATFFGGKDFDYGNSIAVDSQGNAYVVGFFYLSDFPDGCDAEHDKGESDVPVACGAARTSTGKGDVVIGKLNRDGSQMVYSNVLGGSSQDSGRSIAVDSRGNAYVTGFTRSVDFPTTRGAVQTKLGEGASQNAFVARFNAYGHLEYSTYLGGSASDDGHGIAVDSVDNAYVTGYTSSSNFPTTSNAVQRKLAGVQNAFVTKLNHNGTALEYSTLLGGDDYDFGYGIAVNSAGNAYVTGTTYGVFASTFPVTGNAYQTASSGSGDVFVTKLSTDGSSLVYSTFLGGTGYDGARGIAVDNSGHAYVTGFTQSTAFPTTAGAAQTVLKGTEDAFVTKLNSDGSGLVYSTYLGGSGNDASSGIAVSSNGYAYITGYTQSTDLPTTTGAIRTANTGMSPFVAVLNTTGTKLNYSTYLGGSNGDGAYAIAVDSSNNAYITGYTNSADFPATSKAWQPQFNSGASQDAFVAKLSLAPYAAY
jgi:hypothetical protein